MSMQRSWKVPISFVTIEGYIVYSHMGQKGGRPHISEVKTSLFLSEGVLENNTEYGVLSSIGILVLIWIQHQTKSFLVNIRLTESFHDTHG